MDHDLAAGLAPGARRVDLPACLKWISLKPPLKQNFKINGKDLAGMAYFYVNGYSDAQTEAACVAADGKFVLPKLY